MSGPAVLFCDSTGRRRPAFARCPRAGLPRHYTSGDSAGARDEVYARGARAATSGGVRPARDKCGDYDVRGRDLARRSSSPATMARQPRGHSYRDTRRATDAPSERGLGSVDPGGAGDGGRPRAIGRRESYLASRSRTTASSRCRRLLDGHSRTRHRRSLRGGNEGQLWRSPAGWRASVRRRLYARTPQGFAALPEPSHGRDRGAVQGANRWEGQGRRKRARPQRRVARSSCRRSPLGSLGIPRANFARPSCLPATRVSGPPTPLSSAGRRKVVPQFRRLIQAGPRARATHIGSRNDRIACWCGCRRSYAPQVAAETSPGRSELSCEGGQTRLLAHWCGADRTSPLRIAPVARIGMVTPLQPSGIDRI